VCMTREEQGRAYVELLRISTKRGKTGENSGSMRAFQDVGEKRGMKKEETRFCRRGPDRSTPQYQKLKKEEKEGGGHLTASNAQKKKKKEGYTTVENKKERLRDLIRGKKEKNDRFQEKKGTGVGPSPGKGRTQRNQEKKIFAS